MTRYRPVSIRSQAGTWPDEPTTTDCCARCRRGTRAIPGPCGYDLACPNGCHRPALTARTPEERLAALTATLDLLTPPRGAQPRTTSHPKGTR